MFGTVARLKVKPGRSDELIALGRRWTRDEFERSGQIAELFFKVDDCDDEFYLVAAFPDRKSYLSNADHPRTRKHFEKLRELLSCDPEWNDGVIVDMLTVREGI